MQRSVIAFVGAVIVSVTAISAAQKDSSSSTYTGCLVAGSSKGTYSLLSASEKGKKNKDNGKMTLTVVPADPKVGLDPQVSHAVEITGTVAPASGGSDLPVLTAKKVKWHADFCG
jgi:hypothetical protein